MAFEAGRMIAGERASALVVDDNTVIRNINAKLLRILGFEVLTVNDGAEAVDLYRAGEGRFDVIVMDLEMPILNGIEATKELRTMGVDCMIIGATACEDASLRERFREAGLDHLFDKPLSVAKLKSCFN